jgi:hypothetical protein
MVLPDRDVCRDVDPIGSGRRHLAACHFAPRDAPGIRPETADAGSGTDHRGVPVTGGSSHQAADVHAHPPTSAAPDLRRSS